MQQNLHSALQAYIKGSDPPTKASKAASKVGSRVASKVPSRVTSKVPSRAGTPPGLEPRGTLERPVETSKLASQEFSDTLAAKLLDVESVALHEVARLEHVVYQLRVERDSLLRLLAEERGLMGNKYTSLNETEEAGASSHKVGQLGRSMTEDLAVTRTTSQKSGGKNPHPHGAHDARWNLLQQARKCQEHGAPDSSYGNLSQFAQHTRNRGSNPEIHHHRRKSHSLNPADAAADGGHHHHHHHHRRKSHSHGPHDIDSSHLNILPSLPVCLSGRSSLASAINEIEEDTLSKEGSFGPGKSGSFGRQKSASEPKRDGSFGPQKDGSFVSQKDGSSEGSFGPSRSEPNRWSLPMNSQDVAAYRAQLSAPMDATCTSIEDVVSKLEKEETENENVVTDFAGKISITDAGTHDIPGGISITEADVNEVELPAPVNKRLSVGLEPPPVSSSGRVSIDCDPPQVSTSRRVSLSIECDKPVNTSRRVTLSTEVDQPLSASRNASRRVSLEFDPSSGRRASGFLPAFASESTTSTESSQNSDDDLTRFELLPLWLEKMLEDPTFMTQKRFTRIRTSNFSECAQEWALTLSKSDIGLIKEESWLEKTVKRCMMPPTHPLCVIWEIVCFIMIAYDFVVLPLQIFSLPDSTFMVAMEWFQRIHWTISIPFCFFVGYVLKDGKVELRPEKVRRHYGTTWFPFDMLVVVSDWVEVLLKTLEFLGAMRLVKSMRISRIFRMIRVLRTVRLPSYLESLDTRIFSEKTVIFMGIFKISVLFVGLGHLVACAWYAIGCYGSKDVGWVEYYEYTEKSLFYRYMTSLHWALTQFVGNMEIQPQTVVERSFANVMLLCSFMITAWFVSSITARLTRLQIIAGSRDGEFAVLRQYLWHHKISTKLAMRVVKSAQQALYHHMKNLSEKEVQLLICVSEPLRAEMHYEMHFGPLSIHPFFTQLNKFNFHAARGICHTAVKQLSIPDGDLVFSAGEVPRTYSMYFIASGLMNYSYEGVHLEVTERMWACEGVLWTSWVHLGDLTALHEVVIFSLDAEICRQVLTKGQQDAYIAANYAKSFVEYLNENWEKVLDVNMEMENECWILEAIAHIDDSVEPQLTETRRQSAILSDKFGDKTALQLDLGRTAPPVGSWCK